MSRIYLVSCVGQKLDHPAPAEDLYISDWFKKARAYVEWATSYFDERVARGQRAYDTDLDGVEWATGPVTEEGFGYMIIARAPDDPERTPRELRKERDTTAKWRRDLMKRPVSELKKIILDHLSDGEPRTLNRIGVELIDKTGDNVYLTTFQTALLELVSEYRVEFTYNEDPSYILFREMQPKEDQWFILSAKYGLVEPEEVIAPYDLTLKKMPKAERKEWAEEVYETLTMYLAPGDDVWFLAGEYYREFLIDWLLDAGVNTYVPFQGMGIGQQKKWLKEEMERVTR